MVEPSAKEMVQDLSSQLPFILKSQLLSDVFEANITSSCVLSCKIDDFFTVNSRSFESELSPLYAYHFLCAENSFCWKEMMGFPAASRRTRRS